MHDSSMPCSIRQGGSRAVTCRLDARENRSYEVCVVPHCDPASGIIERYEAAAAALVRHTELARWLRAHGWVVIDQIVTDDFSAAPSSDNRSPFSLRGFDLCDKTTGLVGKLGHRRMHGWSPWLHRLAGYRR
jgi:hypothetical protein